MRLNLNETIKVKLTDLGKDIYYHKYDRINAFFGREFCKPSYPKVDDDGYTEFRLWCFIELYGEHIGMACKNVICPNEIVFDAPTIEPEPKWIPCKECLPEVGDYVICSQENGDVGEGKLLPDGDWLILYESAVYGIRWVTAWMPLPEPYREEGEER